MYRSQSCALSRYEGGALDTSVQTEKSPLGRQILCQLQENLEIAWERIGFPSVRIRAWPSFSWKWVRMCILEGGSVEDVSMRASGRAM